MTNSDDMASVYLVGIFIGTLFFIVGFKWFMTKRLLEDLPTSTIRSIAMGLVEINGKAVPCKQTRMLRGPFTNKACVHYECTVERLIRNNNNSDEWKLLKKEEKGNYFYLQDSTGKVLINVKGAKYEVSADFELQIDVLSKDMPDALNKYLETRHLKTHDVIKYKSRLRFTEYDIVVCDKLFVLGSAERNPFVDKNLSEADVDNIMIAKGDNRDKFIISEKSEKELLKKLTKNSFLGIFGGGILIMVCLYLLLRRLNLL
jgi:Ca2+/Na+ antiporter